MSDDLLNELLAKPVGPAIAARPTNPGADLTREVQVAGDVATVTVRGAADAVTEDAATAYLRTQGFDPADWTPTGFRSSTWTLPGGGEGVSTRYTFTRATCTTAGRLGSS